MEINTVTLITNIIIALFAGGVSSLITAKASAKKTTSEADKLKTDTAVEHLNGIINLYKSELDILKKEAKLNEEILLETQSTLAKFAKMVYTMDNNGYKFPLPRWSKNYPSLTISWVNPAYETIFLLPVNKNSVDCLNKTEEFIWGEDFFKESKKNDLASIGARGYWIGHENITINEVDFSKNYILVKWPIRVKDEESNNWIIKSIETMAIPIL